MRSTIMHLKNVNIIFLLLLFCFLFISCLKNATASGSLSASIGEASQQCTNLAGAGNCTVDIEGAITTFRHEDSTTGATFFHFTQLGPPVIFLGRTDFFYGTCPDGTEVNSTGDFCDDIPQTDIECPPAGETRTEVIFLSASSGGSSSGGGSINLGGCQATIGNDVGNCSPTFDATGGSSVLTGFSCTGTVTFTGANSNSNDTAASTPENSNPMEPPFDNRPMSEDTQTNGPTTTTNSDGSQTTTTETTTTQTTGPGASSDAPNTVTEQNGTTTTTTTNTNTTTTMPDGSTTTTDTTTQTTNQAPTVTVVVNNNGNVTSESDPGGTSTGSETTTTSTDGNGDTTTTTTTTGGGIGNGSGSGNGDGEEGGEDEEEGEGSVEGGGDCMQPPVCEGDAIACAILQQQFLSRCVSEDQLLDRDRIFDLGDITLETVTQEFLTALNDIEIVNAVNSFFTLSVAGACPTYSVNTGPFNFTIDQQCSSTIPWPLIAGVILSIAAFFAVRIALT